LAERICQAFERSPRLRLPSRLSNAGAALRPEESTSHTTPTPANGPRLGGMLAFVVTLYFLAPWSVNTFPLLTGPMLLERGHRLSDALLYIAVATFGPALSTFLAGPLVDRVERRVSLTLSCGLMLLAVIVFFASDQPLALASAVIAFAIGVAIYMPIMTTYGADLFPSATRASATTLAWAGNRLAAVMVPVVILPVFAARGSSAIGWEVTLALLATIVLIALFGPKGAAGGNVQ